MSGGNNRNTHFLNAVMTKCKSYFYGAVVVIFVVVVIVVVAAVA